MKLWNNVECQDKQLRYNIRFAENIDIKVNAFI